jgi:hypothetical protein
MKEKFTEKYRMQSIILAEDLNTSIDTQRSFFEGAILNDKQKLDCSMLIRCYSKET